VSSDKLVAGFGNKSGRPEYKRCSGCNYEVHQGIGSFLELLVLLNLVELGGDTV
jgi:hypothetical protein